MAFSGLKTSNQLLDASAMQSPLGGSTPAQLGHPINPDAYRRVRITVPRVELKFYRKSRTSADTLPQNPHFVYLISISWAIPPAEDDEELEPVARDPWWQALPENYILRRTWRDILHFHTAVSNTLAFDQERGVGRVSAKMPNLPPPGELEKFQKIVAATGDIMALNRNFENRGTGEEGDPWGELSILHALYVENRLQPYFKELSNLLAEVPLEVLRTSPDFKRFVSTGSAGKKPPASAMEAVQRKYCGRLPVKLNSEDLAAPVAAHRKTMTSSVLARHMASSQPSFRRLPAPEEEVVRPASTLPASQPPPPPRGRLPSNTLADMKPWGSVSTPGFFLSSSTSKRIGSFSSPPGTAEVPATPTATEVLEITRYPDRRAGSHYGFFFEKLKDREDFGYKSKELFWKVMHQKERASVSRRALLNASIGTGPRGKFGEEEGHEMDFLVSGKPSTFPPSPANTTSSWGWSPKVRTTTATLATATATTTTSTATATATAKTASDLKALASSSPKAKAAARNQARSTSTFRPSKPRILLQVETLLWDFAEGLRCCILGETPVLQSMSTRMERGIEEKPPPTEEQTLQVYRVYKRIRRGIACVDADISDDEEPTKDTTFLLKPFSATSWRALPNAPKVVMFPGKFQNLEPMPWSNLMEWGEQQEESAIDFRKKSVTSALNRSLKNWYEVHATLEQRRAGVPLDVFMSWIWPGLTSEWKRKMMCWICLSEIEKVRQPTPRLIDSEQRKQLEKLFESMDADAKGACCPEDIAGGEDQGAEAKLKNIVDPDTVRAFCGDRQIHFREFAELMCEDDCRAHPDSRSVALEKGGRMVKHSREFLGKSWWMYEDPPAHEVPCRKLIESIEVEIKRWRRLAALEAANLQPLTAIP